jgi:LmbE family N-acetylglucosaminyl deacetylase
VEKHLRNTNAVLATVFSRSAYAYRAVERAGTESVITQQRQSEDRRYCESRGLRQVLLGQPDSSLAGYDDESELLPPRGDDTRAADASLVLDDLFRKIQPDVVVGPAGLGNHVDHLIVTKWIRDQTIRRDTKTLFFEDLPYVAGLALRYIDRRMELDGLKACLCLNVTSVMAAKVAAMQIYESQLEELSVPLMVEHAARLAIAPGSFVERFWA